MWIEDVRTIFLSPVVSGSDSLFLGLGAPDISGDMTTDAHFSVINSWTEFHQILNEYVDYSWHFSVICLNLLSYILCSVSMPLPYRSLVLRTDVIDCLEKPCQSGWVSRGLTSHSTLYRSLRGRFLQARWPNQQRQSTEGSQLAGLSVPLPPLFFPVLHKNPEEFFFWYRPTWVVPEKGR